MTQSDYLFILLDGYANHKEFLAEYFYRSFKDAEQKHIGIVEFFKRLIEANEALIQNIKEQYYERLNEVNLMKSLSRKTGEEPIDWDAQMPAMENFSVHLHSFTNGLFFGHLWGWEIAVINKAISEAIDKIKPVAYNDITPDLKVDLTKFNLITDTAIPYLKQNEKNGIIYIYEGAIGKNRYRYLEMPVKSQIGKLFKSYFETDYGNKKDSDVPYLEFNKIITKAEKEASTIIISGNEAFYKYWQTLTSDNKKAAVFYSIPDFRALKEWHELALSTYLETNKLILTNAEVKKIALVKKLTELKTEIEGYLILPDVQYKYSLLTTEHAFELNRFYEWIKNEIKKLSTSNNETLKSTQITAPAFALFCSIVHQSGLVEMRYDESKESYCKRVSEYFRINANPNKVRQYFSEIMSIKNSDKYLKIIIHSILPNIENVLREKIQSFIDSNTKLYS